MLDTIQKVMRHVSKIKTLFGQNHEMSYLAEDEI